MFKKILKFFFSFVAVLSTILVLVILYDLTSYDPNYLNRNSIVLSKNNLNSKKIKFLFNFFERKYLNLKFNFSKNFRDSWLPEDEKKRASQAKEIFISGKKNNFSKGRSVQEIEKYLENWHRSHGNIFSLRFSKSDKINRENVSKLKLAWTYRSEDGKKGIQANPVIFNGKIFMPTPGNSIVSLDGKNGKVIWKKKIGKGFHAAKRGIQIWEDKKNNLVKLFLTNDDQIISLNAKNGEFISNFGNNGVVKSGSSPIPPIILGNDLIIATFKPSIEVYDVYSGKIKWKYYLRDTQTESKFSEFKGGNPWGGISADDKLGVIYLATGNPHPNYIGVNRPGKNLFSNSVIAFDIKNKKKLWHFQETCHDLWNNDLPAPPILTTLNLGNKRVDVVVVVTKLGNTIILDRRTGESIFDYKKVRVPVSKLRGEKTCPYQPVFSTPESFAKFEFKKSDVTELSKKDKNFINSIVKNSEYGFFTPYSLDKKTIQYGDNGGAVWSGATINPYTNIMYVTANNIPWVVEVKSNKEKGIPIYTAKAEPLRDLNNYPGVKPPWGTITAINLNNGKKIWQIPFGFYRELKEKGIFSGTENFGGATATAGDILFATGTLDKRISAFDVKNGEELWSFEMPFIGSAPPSVYEIDNEQYVVVPASGGIVLKMFYPNLVTQGDAVVAFKLAKN